MRKLVIIFFVLVGLQCREKYDVMLATPDRGILVVEGIVNTNGETNIKLSRTTPLSDSVFVPETAATVVVEGEDNSRFILSQLDSGRYFSPQLSLNLGTRYRLRITTFDRKEYLSDFRNVLQTQEIDSISYQLENEGVQFYVNSSEENGEKIYYKWEFDETWEFHSANLAMLKFIATPNGDGTHTVELGYIDTITFGVADTLYYCWQNRMNRNINIGSTAQLEQSNIFLPILFLKTDSWELSVLYSLLVRQFALSKDGYEFYRKMKKNSESLGSIFDAQPSEIIGNITCVSNPAELVVGFVEFTSQVEKRIFVSNEEIPGKDYYHDCPVFGGDPEKFEYPFLNRPDRRAYAYDVLGLVPTKIGETLGRDIVTFHAERPECVDCRLRGTNVKPTFWPQ